MPCSPITLSLATICAVVSVALLGIAFGTDNWQEFKITTDKFNLISPNEYDNMNDPEMYLLYYNRTKGLFRICFPEKKPPQREVPTYISPIETFCRNIDYHLGSFPQRAAENEDEKARLYMARSVIALLIVSFIFIFVACFTGLVGCWKRSPLNIGATAVFMLFACLFSAGAMGLWHTVEYYETEKIKEWPYRGAWDDDLEKYTNVMYSWSYFIAWIGVGWALVSALLFSGASVCLRNEREKETKNMAYLMPVYQQKQQYPTYGYGYPGPYHYGAQPYGHYNY